MADRPIVVSIRRTVEMQSHFKEAQQYVQEQQAQGVVASEAVRGRLYGLGKQATEGDCRMPCPPSSNNVLRAKWDAWTGCKGLSQEDAMAEYLSLVHKHYPAFKISKSASGEETNFTSTVPYPLSTAPSFKLSASNSIIKQGTLFKQRDVFKGWRPRKFILQDSFLHYYVETDEITPHKSIDISGSTIIEVKANRVADVDYFPFVISNQKSSKVYNLAASTKLDADDWIAKIREASLKQPQMWNSQGAVFERLLERKVKEEDIEVDQKIPIVNSESTLLDIPSKYAPKVECAVQAILSAIDPQSDNWETLYEKHGVIAKRRLDGAITVKSESSLPYLASEIFEVLINQNKMKKLDPQTHALKISKSYSSHTFVQYKQLKQTWPTSQRDFSNLLHWRLLSDNRIVIIAFSEKLDDICPLAEKNVRAELVLGGFVLKPQANGTLVHFVSQTDLKLSLSMGIINLITENQPLVLANVRRYLENTSHKTSVARGKFNVKVVYEDLIDKFNRSLSTSEPEETPPTVTALSAGSSKAAPSTGNEAQGDDSVAANTPAQQKVQRVKSAVSSMVQKMVSQVARTSNRPDKRKITPISMLVVLTPSLLYYIAEPKFRVVAFIIGLFFSFRYLFRLHHGVPAGNFSVSSDRVFNSADGPKGISRLHRSRMVIRFPIDLGKLLRYLDAKREESGYDISPTHITAKAVGMTFAEIPRLNGNILFGYFYRSKTPGVDISVSVDIADKYTSMVKVVDVDVKPLEYIANELQTRSKEIRQHSSNIATTQSQSTTNQSSSSSDASNIIEIIKELVPVLRIKIQQLFDYIGSNMGISIPQFGIVGYPYGVCSIMTSLNREGSDADIDIAVVPNEVASGTSSAPVIISIGGIRILPSFDSDRKLIANPVLNYTISIDTAIGSLTECRKFCSKLQNYLNNPHLLDKADRKMAVAKEDEKLATEKGKKKGLL